MTYVRFQPAHRLAEYLGQSGHEIGGLRLTPVALDALATSKTKGTVPELEVIGEYVHEDGRRWLDYGVPRAYIESTTDMAWDADVRRYRYRCPDCDMRDDRHTKTCGRR